MGFLDGKVAMVTGAGRGQGRAHCVALAEEGAEVVAVDIAAEIDGMPYPPASAEQLEETVRLVEARDSRAIAVKADVRSQGEMDAAFAAAIESFGQVDVVIANAGIWDLTPAWEITEDQWTRVLQTNLDGAWHTARAVLPHFRERQTGQLIFISSVNGVEPAYNNAHYTAAKHGVIGLMRSLALELAPFNVRCNAIIPGAVDTPMNDWQGALDLFAGKPGEGTLEDRAAAGRSYSLLPDAGMLPPEAIADAARWLLSPGARFVTGVVLPVDAGHLITPGYS